MQSNGYSEYIPSADTVSAQYADQGKQTLLTAKIGKQKRKAEYFKEDPKASMSAKLCSWRALAHLNVLL